MPGGSLLSNPPNYTFAHPQYLGQPGIEVYLLTLEGDPRKYEIYAYQAGVNPATQLQEVKNKCNKQYIKTPYTVACYSPGEECYATGSLDEAVIIICPCKKNQ
ncbi:MAG: hypothetical protein AAFR61_16565 [Bacteroidota bacterium]